MPEQFNKKNNKPEIKEPEKVSTPKEQIEQVLFQAKVGKEVVSLENNEFAEIILLKKDQKSEGKMVRVYRGINQIDQNILKQTPYAMRTIFDKGGKREVKILDDLKSEVNNIANNPTYENLLKYIVKVKPRLQPNEVEWLEKDLEKIEEDVLKGRSIRSSLNFMQYGHGGGAPDVALTPYVSATTNPLEAAKYGNVIMVMDVPVSMISDFGRVRHGEISLKGEVDQEFVTALIPRREVGKLPDEKLELDLKKALNKLEEKVETQLLTELDSNSARQEQLEKELESDKEQNKNDLILVRQKRTDRLSQKYPEANINAKSRQEQLRAEDLDIYSKAKEIALDHFSLRLDKISQVLGGTAEEYLEEISEKVKEKFDRKNISETFLKKIKEQVDVLERKANETEEQRRIRKLIQNS